MPVEIQYSQKEVEASLNFVLQVMNVAYCVLGNVGTSDNGSPWLHDIDANQDRVQVELIVNKNLAEELIGPLSNEFPGCVSFSHTSPYLQTEYEETSIKVIHKFV